MKQPFSDSADILIVGAGIVGIALARDLAGRGAENIVVLEKEPEQGRHASGRNSGVLHAGIYYAAESLKAKYCVRGNRLMRDYCLENGLQILETGKVVVARSAGELPVLEELGRRAAANCARVEMIDEKQLAGIEPNARTVEKALFSHYTAMVDPREVLGHLTRSLVASGQVRVETGRAFTGLSGSHTALTNRGPIRFTRFINAAGAHCDRVAHHFGVGRRYRMTPFKGIYWKLKPTLPWTVRGNIYPVPDIRNPFLGVHFTRNVHGDIYLGPTAIPAFGRENYGVLAGIDREAPAIALTDAVLFAANPKFRTVALTEPRKYLKPFFFQDASKLVRQLAQDDLAPTPKAGIRAQLVDWESRELVMDFLVEKDGDALHILNPISPAFTCSLYMAGDIVERYLSGWV